jgi:hypothetical protein
MLMDQKEKAIVCVASPQILAGWAEPFARVPLHVCKVAAVCAGLVDYSPL